MAIAGDEMTERDNTAYPERYGQWGGNPRGFAPNYERCCAEVTPNERGGGARRHQCNNKRGYGPGLAYCKTHNPDAVAAKRAERQAAYDAKWEARRYEWHGREFFNALDQIANGHNDARGLAQEIIAKFKEGER